MILRLHFSVGIATASSTLVLEHLLPCCDAFDGSGNCFFALILSPLFVLEIFSGRRPVERERDTNSLEKETLFVTIC